MPRVAWARRPMLVPEAVLLCRASGDHKVQAVRPSAMAIGAAVSLMLAAMTPVATHAATGSTAAITIRTYQGAPPGAAPTQTPRGEVPMSVDRISGKKVRVTVWGSGSCPPFGKRAVTNAKRTAVRVRARSYQGACTADFSPATTVVTFGRGVHLERRVRITFIDQDGGRLALTAR